MEKKDFNFVKGISQDEFFAMEELQIKKPCFYQYYSISCVDVKDEIKLATRLGFLSRIIFFDRFI